MWVITLMASKRTAFLAFACCTFLDLLGSYSKGKHNNMHNKSSSLDHGVCSNNYKFKKTIRFVECFSNLPKSNTHSYNLNTAHLLFRITAFNQHHKTGSSLLACNNLWHTYPVHTHIHTMPHLVTYACIWYICVYTYVCTFIWYNHMYPTHYKLRHLLTT